MVLYDAICKKCHVIVRDVVAVSSKKIREKCPRCGKRMVWHPSFGSVDAREPWYCVQTDRTYSSFRELEKVCAKEGRVVLDKKDYDKRLSGGYDQTEERLEKTGVRKEVRETMDKIAYRTRHGYRKLENGVYRENMG